MLTWISRLAAVTLQVLLLVGFTLLGQGLMRIAHLPFPGSLAGLILLFILLQLRIVKIEWFEQGASFLLAEMLLFFVPSATGIVQYGQLVRSEGWQVVIVIAASTVLVMIVSGVVAELWTKSRRRTSTEG